jgi:ABC-2 type transport system permease protein
MTALHRSARPGTVGHRPGAAAVDGRAPGAGAIIVLTVWLRLFGSYAVLSHRRGAETM